MKRTRKEHVEALNSNFDKVHYLQKEKRSIESLFRTLLYFSEKYKKDINSLQAQLSQLGGQKVNLRRSELVACSIAAKSRKIGVFGTSHKLLNKSGYHYCILSALKPLGTLGKVPNSGNKNALGKCAEIKAANNILLKDKKSCISDIKFSTAIRPRTSEAMNRCDNCIAVFGHE